MGKKKKKRTKEKIDQENDKSDMINKIVAEESLKEEFSEVYRLLFENIVNPIMALSNAAPFTISFVAKSSLTDRIIQLNQAEDDFNIGDTVYVIKLNNFDYTGRTFAPFFRANVGNTKRVFVRKNFHDDFRVKDKVIIIKPVLKNTIIGPDMKNVDESDDNVFSTVESKP